MMSRASHRPIRESGAWIGRDVGASRVDRSNRRRLIVFLPTLVVALVASLGYVWLRPAEYRATARIEITPGTTAAPNAPNAPIMNSEPESARPFLTEVQILTSRPVLEEVATRLARGGQNPSLFGSDLIAGMQARLAALPIPQTNVVELVGTGPDADILAPLVNTTIEVYRDRLVQAYESLSSEALAQADEEVKKLQVNVETKRREIDAFRLRHNVVSLERDENQVLAQVRTLSANLGLANEKVAAAEGKLRALTESTAAGNSVTRTRDDGTLANLEQRASQAREDLREMERTFTQDFLTKEPKAIALRTRLAELERQIAAQRGASQKAALVDAQDELAGATAAAARIQGQMAAGRQEVGQFTTRFNEYKSRQDDLAELEKTFRAAAQKRARLEASERSRMPAAKVIEAASTPREPWRPLYWRDSAIAAGGSLVLALLAMWLVELFNRTEPQPAVVLVRAHSNGMSYEGRLDALSRQGAPPLASVERTESPLLPLQSTLPRELEHGEAEGLLQASDDATRLLVLLLLSGLTADEAIAVRAGDVDLERGIIKVGGAAGREISLGDALRRELAVRTVAEPSDPLLHQGDQSATRESVDTQILCAAHDAGLADPANVNAACVRHTYVAYLVRQGIRFADLTSLVGELPAQLLGAYTTFAPPGPRVARERIDTSYPAVRTQLSG
jgi:succinoglycan biosynthesis transport protein ExoP